MVPLCVYHKADLDGVCSAAIVKHFVPECELHGMDYGDEFPWDRVMPTVGVSDPASVGEYPRTVCMVDFSLGLDDMTRLAEAAELVWIDHHKTAIEALCVPGGPRFKYYNCRSSYAACELTWESLRHSVDEAIPEAVRLLGAYDSWRKDDPDWDTKIMPFQYGMRSIPGIYAPKCPAWENHCWLPSGERTQLSNVFQTQCLGAAVLSFQQQQNRKVAEAGAFEARLALPDPYKQPIVVEDKEGNHSVVHPGPRYRLEGGKCERISDAVLPVYRCVCLNTPIYNSQAFDSVWDPGKHDVMVAFAKVVVKSQVYRGDLGGQVRWKVSLYSVKPEVDCGEIAKAFGGGGHKGAAGFMCDWLPWEN
jgi:hypothetical protein